MRIRYREWNQDGVSGADHEPRELFMCSHVQ